jgi:hypothetical protein
MGNKFERFVGRAIPRIVPEGTLLTSRLAEWYVQNESHRYQTGDVLILRGFPGNDIFTGFGIRPIGTVLDYEKQEVFSGRGKQEYFYRISMEQDGTDPDTDEPGRITRVEDHFKWNIEHHFVKLPKGMTPEQALQRYGQS